MFRPAPVYYDNWEVISPLSDQALSGRLRSALALGAAATLTWIANLAVFIPFGLARPLTVREVWWANGSAAGANVDVGVYDTAGNRLFSMGSTAQGAANATGVQSVALTDYTLSPGDYYMAIACSGTTNTLQGWSPLANNAAGLGVGQVALGSVTLTSTATIVPLTNAVLPFFGLNGSTVAP